MKNKIGKREIDKKEFFELYENAKRGKVDLYQLQTEILEMMCILLEEEIKMIRKENEKLNANLNG